MLVVNLLFLASGQAAIELWCLSLCPVYIQPERSRQNRKKEKIALNTKLIISALSEAGIQIMSFPILNDNKNIYAFKELVCKQTVELQYCLVGYKVFVGFLNGKVFRQVWAGMKFHVWKI